MIISVENNFSEKENKDEIKKKSDEQWMKIKKNVVETKIKEKER